jgi:hypothetical protein
MMLCLYTKFGLSQTAVRMTQEELRKLEANTERLQTKVWLRRQHASKNKSTQRKSKYPPVLKHVYVGKHTHKYVLNCASPSRTNLPHKRKQGASLF